MTVNDVYIAALALLGGRQAQADEYLSVVLPVVNLLLSEMFDAENSIRLAAGENELNSPQRVNSMQDNLTYAEPLVSQASLRPRRLTSP